jgi:enoyl-CoA hydratase
LAEATGEELADQPVLVDRRDSRMIITLNRPRVLNAQNHAMREGLAAACDELDDDDSIRVAILRGAGRAFSAGADIREREERRARLESTGRSARRWKAAGFGRYHFDRLEAVRKPVIAAIHGYAVGGGLELALCCDIRIATRDAQLGTPEPRTVRGIPGIAIHRLAGVAPLGEALRLMLTSQAISGSRAYDIGLVQEVADDPEALWASAERMVDQMLECEPASLVAIKQAATWTHQANVARSERFTQVVGNDW